MKPADRSPHEAVRPPRIAILVLGCLLPVYERCIRVIRATWGAESPDNIDIFYLYGRQPLGGVECVDLGRVLGQDAPELPENESLLVGDVILCGTGDLYADQIDCVLRKRLLAFGYLARREEYDFVYNVCASSYVDLDELQRYVGGLAPRGVYHGPLGVCEFSGFPFVSGASMLLSKDLVTGLASSADEMIAINDGAHPDDVVMGRWIAEQYCHESLGEICDRIAVGERATDSQHFVLPNGQGMTSWVHSPRDDQVPQPDVFHYHFHTRRIWEMVIFHRQYFNDRGVPDRSLGAVN